MCSGTCNSVHINIVMQIESAGSCGMYSHVLRPFMHSCFLGVWGIRLGHKHQCHEPPFNITCIISTCLGKESVQPFCLVNYDILQLIWQTSHECIDLD